MQTATIGGGVPRPVPRHQLGRAEDWEFRVGWAQGTPQEASTPGTVRREPDREDHVNIAMVNCTIHSYRLLENESSGAPTLPGEKFLRPLHDGEPVLPVRRAGRQHSGRVPTSWWRSATSTTRTGRPTLTGPTPSSTCSRATTSGCGRSPRSPGTRRRSASSTTTTCTTRTSGAGQAGRATRGLPLGGYIMPACWVNTVQRIQCAHNPDPTTRPRCSRASPSTTARSATAACRSRCSRTASSRTRTSAARTPTVATLPSPRELLGATSGGVSCGRGRRCTPGSRRSCLTQTVVRAV